MAVTERLALLIDADGRGAIKELEKVGKTAERELGRAESKIDKWGAQFTSVGSKMIATSAVLGVAMWNAAGSAASLGEAVDYSGRVFGSAADDVDKFAASAAKIGMSKREALEAANTFGSLLKATGATRAEMAGMSIDMTKLAADMASARDTTPEDAITALGAALRGESEPIRRYGVLLDDFTLKQRAMDMGLIRTTTGTLPPAIKMQAAYAEIVAQTATMQGNFLDTAESAPNKMRNMQAEMENAKASIGEGFLPVMTAMVGSLSKATAAFGGLNDATGGAVGNILGISTVTLGVGGAALFAAGKMIALRTALMTAAAAGNVWSSAMLGALGPVGGGLAALAVGYALIEKRANDGAKAVSNLDASMRESVLEASPDKLRAQFSTLGREIDGLQESIKDSAAPWDRFYRRDLSLAGVAAQDLQVDIAKMVGQMEYLADVTGDSEDAVLAFIQAEEAAGRTYQDNSVLLDAYNKSLVEGETASVNARMSQADLNEQFEKSTSEVDKLIKLVDEYYDRLDSTIDREIAWEDSTDRLRESLRENGTAWNWMTGEIDLSTEAGRENMRALMKSRDAAVEFGKEQRRQGESVKVAANTVSGYTANLKKMMEQAGYTDAQIDAILESLGLMPAQVNSALLIVGLDENLEKLREIERILAVNEQIMSTFTGMLPGITQGVMGKISGKRAGGGPTAAGGAYLVGENGPELLVMGSDGGQVLSAQQTQQALGGGGGGAQTVVVPVYLDGRKIAEVVTPHLANDRRSRTGSRKVA